MEKYPYSFLILAGVVACIAWTVTKEEIFKEPRSYCTENQNPAIVCGREFFLCIYL